MLSSIRLSLLCILIFLTGWFPSAFAQTNGPHLLYETRCGGCHAPHAGEFVHNNLFRSGDRILGRQSNRELREYLNSGHGRLSHEETTLIVTHLTNIQLSGRLFYNKCIICHDRAVVFARRKLILKDGVLMGRYTKRNIEQFLYSHGRLKADEVPKMVGVLKRQLNTQKAN